MASSGRTSEDPATEAVVRATIATKISKILKGVLLVTHYDIQVAGRLMIDKPINYPENWEVTHKMHPIL
jgi:hypothetical protein